MTHGNVNVVAVSEGGTQVMKKVYLETVGWATALLLCMIPDLWCVTLRMGTHLCLRVSSSS